VYSIFFGITFLFFAGNANAQKKVVVMGSSTAAGTGASSYANSWVARLDAYYHQNVTDNLDTTVTNIALGGTVTYNDLQNGLAPVPGRPYPPDPNRNVDKALSYFPDVVIINLPTNDIASAYSKTEFMFNLRQMYTKIVNANVRCYITTTQPRNLSVDQRQQLRDLVDSIKNAFGIYSIDFWTDIVTTDGSNQIRYAVSAGDSIHVNDAGHNFLFIRVRDRQIFPSSGPLPLNLTDFKVQLKNNTATAEWRTELEEPNTSFELQRSAGINFTTLHQQRGTGNSAASTYSWTDQFPLSGQSYYRLHIIEPSKESYSRTVSVFNKAADLDINKLYYNNSSSIITADIRIKKSQAATISIVNTIGAVVLKQSLYISGPVTRLTLPVGRLAEGQYFLSIRTADDNSCMKSFNK
jgi:lysophospholipase L1-like esterase